jgi:hypothetical protein
MVNMKKIGGRTYQVLTVGLKSIPHSKESAERRVPDELGIVLESAEKDRDFPFGGHGTASLARGRGRDLDEGIDRHLAGSAARL